MTEITPLTLEDIQDEFHPDNINPQPSTPIVVYLFSHAVGAGDEDNNRADTSLPYSNHKDTLDQYEDTLDEIEELGWIERTEDTISLCPTGISIAGPLYWDVHDYIHSND